MDMDTFTAIAKIRIRRPPSEVFRAFVDAAAMSQFWFTRKDAGLKAGEVVTWFIGSGEDSYSFEVLVKELRHPEKILIAWENQGGRTEVTWTLVETEEGDTILTIKETGFGGSRDAVIEQVLDSTGGFNQVIVAAKAYIEHGVSLNVVADHV